MPYNNFSCILDAGGFCSDVFDNKDRNVFFDGTAAVVGITCFCCGGACVDSCQIRCP